MGNYETREFMIFSTSELNKIDFNQVLETSSETVRKSVDGTKTFVKWDGEEIPSSIQLLESKQGPYTYTQMLEILNGEEWTEETEEFDKY
jgi:hypothetical protein